MAALFLILLLKNARYSYDEINSLCVALKEWFPVDRVAWGTNLNSSHILRI